MKVFVLSLLSLLFISATSTTTCDIEEFKIDCEEHINEDHFIVVKEFELHSENGESLEFSFTLSAKMDYELYFTGHDWSHHTMEVQFLDPEHKSVTSNHNSDHEYMHKITIHPKKIGIHYMNFHFEEGESFCGYAVLGFKKHEAETDQYKW